MEMEKENHQRTNQSGHGVHVCHKCGWPFPNPHPSAKNRRAHKKICGTIEGFKLGAASSATDLEEDVSNISNDMDSTVSVGGHDSDNDLKTPSSKTVNRKSSDGVGSHSITPTRSEDDFFSDAITDFAHSPLDEVSDCVREPANLVRKISYGQTEENQLNVNNSAAPVTLCPTNTLVHGKQQLTDQVPGNEKEPMEWNMLSKEVVDETVKQSSVISVLLDTDAKDSEVILKDIPVQDELSSNRTGRKLPDTIAAAEESNGEPLDLQSVNPVMKFTEKQSIGLEAHQESTSQFSIDEVIDVCVYSEQVMCHSEGDVGISTDMGESHDAMISLNKNINSSVVPDGLSQEEHPATVCEGYKDCKAGISGILVPDSVPIVECVGQKDDHVAGKVRVVEYVGHKEDVTEEVPAVECVGRREDHHASKELPAVECVGCKEDHVSKELPAIECAGHKEDYVTKESHSIEACQNAVVSTPCEDDVSSYVDLVEEKLENESEQRELTIAEISIGDLQVQGMESKAPVVCVSSVMEVSSDGSGTKPRQTVGSLEEQNSEALDSSAEDLSRKEQEIHSVKDEGADFDDKAETLEGLDINDSKNAGDAVPEAMILTESADATPLVSQTINSPRSYDASNHDGVGLQTVNTIATAERSVLDEENQFIDSKRSSECEFHTLELHGGMDTVKELEVNDEVSHLDTVSELGKSGQYSSSTESLSLQNNLSIFQDDDNEHKISENKMVGADCNDGFDTISAAACNDNVVLTRKETVYIDAVSSFRISDDVDYDTKELGRGTSGVADRSLQVDSDKNLMEQNCALAIDALPDSASQTDSLEGHWGSVSVLSDAPTVTDAETLPVMKSQASEAPSLKPKATVNDQQIDKSNVPEPPTSTISGEPSVIAETQESCEIQTLENSITHISDDLPRKGRNEEIIAKVNNWSTGSGKQHTPLKNLLGEAYDDSRANSPNPKKDGVSVTNNDAPGEEPLGMGTAKARAEAEKEWNSPARYPASIERKKGKVKSKPYWVPLFCCSSSIHSN